MFYLEKRFVDEMVAQARAEAPNECCGIIAGANGHALKLYPTTNIERSPVMYRIDPKELFRIYKEVEDKGWEMLAFYHSHTFSEAYPSPTDVRLAAWPDSLYIVISLQKKDSPVIRAFRIVEGKITEEKLGMIEGNPIS
ncbi:MAG: M67 family metallopeptidase [Chloroflexi bacterium]|nr:M67 family metallopeptidase [Chloroflexota bacterium]